MKENKINGLNHITLAVSDIESSISFYSELLGFKLCAQWSSGAYLESGNLWLCLSLDENSKKVIRSDYTHYAFNVSDQNFDKISELISKNSILWKENKSEGKSLYFLDPDGHKLEIHVGTLKSRLDFYKNNPEKGVVIY